MARAAFQNAASVIDADYRCDYAYHAQMEPLNAVAAVAPDGGSVEIWAGTQSQTTAHGSASQTAQHFAATNVKLHDLPDGRRFRAAGANRDVDFIIDAVMLSKEVKRPVKVMWTREDDVHNGRFPAAVRALSSVRRLISAGKLTAWHHRLAGDRVTQFTDPVSLPGRRRPRRHADGRHGRAGLRTCQTC